MAKKKYFAAFGILAHRFRFLLMTVRSKPARVKKMVQAACVLHNMLKGSSVSHSKESNTGSRTFFPLEHSKVRSGAVAVAVRERLSDYFSGDGAVSWQDARAGWMLVATKRKQAWP